MATFYGGVWGTRGPATRMGSKDSGMCAYAQSYGSRITVNYGEDRDEGTYARITLGGGWTTYYREHSISFNPDVVAEALDTGDERMLKIWTRIVKEFSKLNEEAPVALRRAARARKAVAA